MTGRSYRSGSIRLTGDRAEALDVRAALHVERALALAEAP